MYCSFINQSMEDPKLFNMFKNQSSRLIRRGGTRGFPLFDLDRGLFLSYLSSKLGREVEILYVNLVGAIYVPYGSLYFLNPLDLLKIQKCSFFGWIFPCFEFVPCLTLLQIELTNNYILGVLIFQAHETTWKDFSHQIYIFFSK